MDLENSINIEETLATSPLEFQEDYFASNVSTDDINNIESSAVPDNSSEISQRNRLYKTTSIMSLSDPRSNKNTGIMFKDLRTVPMSGINLENASLKHVKNIQDDNLLSVNQLDDTASTIINGNPNEADLEHENIEQFVCSGYPFEFNGDLDYSDSSNEPDSFFNHKQHFFMLSSAGKPIYTMHGSYDIFVVYSGIIQTIVSFFQYSPNGEEKVKVIESKDVHTGRPVKFVFLDKSPIILMSITQSHQSTHLEIEQQLDFIYSFILSTLSKPYIDKIFNKYANFDLRNLLGKTDVATLDSICESLANNLNISQVLGGLQCLRMHLSVRTRLERKLMNFKSDSLLYGLIVGPNEKLISIMRPKRHTLHTSDLMILFEMIFNTNTFKSKNTETEEGDSNEHELKITTNETFWVPICLPKFNSSGHLYSLIQFYQLNDERLFKLHDIENLPDENIDPDGTKIGIILMSPYKDKFNELRKISSEIAKTILFDHRIYRDIWNSLIGNGRIVVEKIIGNKTTDANKSSQTTNRGKDANTFSSLMSQLNINSNEDNLPHNAYTEWSGILHFTVRSKRSVQCIFPESIYFDINNKKVKRNLLSVYKYLRHQLQAIWTDSVCLDLNDSNDRLIVERNDKNGITGGNGDNNTVIYEEWIDENYDNERVVGFACKFGTYEVFILGKGEITESEMLNYGLKITKWIRKQDNRVFISSGCIF